MLPRSESLAEEVYRLYFDEKWIFNALSRPDTLFSFTDQYWYRKGGHPHLGKHRNVDRKVVLRLWTGFLSSSPTIPTVDGNVYSGQETLSQLWHEVHHCLAALPRIVTGLPHPSPHNLHGSEHVTAFLEALVTLLGPWEAWTNLVGLNGDMSLYYLGCCDYGTQPWLWIGIAATCMPGIPFTEHCLKQLHSLAKVQTPAKMKARGESPWLHTLVACTAVSILTENTRLTLRLLDNFCKSFSPEITSIRFNQYNIADLDAIKGSETIIREFVKRCWSFKGRSTSEPMDADFVKTLFHAIQASPTTPVRTSVLEILFEHVPAWENLSNDILCEAALRNDVALANFVLFKLKGHPIRTGESFRSCLKVGRKSNVEWLPKRLHETCTSPIVLAARAKNVEFVEFVLANWQTFQFPKRNTCSRKKTRQNRGKLTYCLCSYDDGRRQALLETACPQETTETASQDVGMFGMIVNASRDISLESEFLDLTKYAENLQMFDILAAKVDLESKASLFPDHPNPITIGQQALQICLDKGYEEKAHVLVKHGVKLPNQSRVQKWKDMVYTVLRL